MKNRVHENTSIYGLIVTKDPRVLREPWDLDPSPSSALDLVGRFRPFGVEGAFFVGALVGVGSEVVALGLGEVLR
jgi:hypothetical protein